MAKKVEGYIKLQIPAGNANPAPPVGPALGQKGVNIMDFCKQFNAKTESQAGYIIPVVIDVYEDRSFSFVTKSPPAAVLIKKALNLSKGSAQSNKTKVGTINQAQLEEIAKSSKMITEEVSGIADTLATQTEEIQQINVGIEQINDVVQSNSATSEECAAASQEMNNEAEHLRDMIRELKVAKFE